MSVRIAVVQPLSHSGDAEWRNTRDALAWIEQAAAAGARYVIFPEGYPGPYTGPMDLSGALPAHPVELLREKARQVGVYVSSGHLEPHPELAGAYWLAHKLIAPDGRILADYHRVQPNHPYFNAYLMGGRYHVLPGDEFACVQTAIGRIGLLICSELFVPELSRTLMLMGADLIVAPGGGVHGATRTRLADTWRCVARARAAENLVFVALNQNVFASEQRGRSCVAGPERMLATVDSGPGLAIADLDLNRLQEIRSRFYDEEILTPPESEDQVFHCRPGQNHDRRPELYGLLTAPQPDAFDYNYHRRGLDSFPEEYAKARRLPRPRTASGR